MKSNLENRSSESGFEYETFKKADRQRSLPVRLRTPIVIMTVLCNINPSDTLPLRCQWSKRPFPINGKRLFLTRLPHYLLLCNETMHPIDIFHERTLYGSRLVTSPRAANSFFSNKILTRKCVLASNNSNSVTVN